MEIIGEKARLTDCNVKIVEKEKNSSYDIGDTFSIKCIHYNTITLNIKNPFIACYIKNASLILDDVFLEKFKTEDIVINCETEKEATEFCNWMYQKGLKWSSGDKYNHKTCFSIYTSDTCYTGTGHYSDKLDFKETGHTIIKFKDCIIPNDSNSEKEFIEYWKKNDIYIKFDNLEDKKKFTIQFDNLCQDTSYLCCPFVCWESNEWVHTDYPINNYNIINYKDIKNWKEILLNKEEEDMTYKIKENLILKDVVEADPCTDAFNQFCKDLMNDGYDAIEIIEQDIRIIIDMLEYPSVKENIQWCIDKGFIIEVKKFKPFDLTLNIENEDMLLDLWHRFNCNDDEIYRDRSFTYKKPKSRDNTFSFFKQVDKEMYRLND